MRTLFLTLLALGLTACGQAQPAAEPTGPLPPQPVREVVFTPPNGTPMSTPIRVVAEVVETDTTRAHGMMFRESLKPGHGMLFLWPELNGAPQRNVFWMKNTLISLDMIFIHAEQVVAIIPSAPPLTETPQDPGVDSSAVLEVPGGWAATVGLKPGWRVHF